MHSVELNVAIAEIRAMGTHLSEAELGADAVRLARTYFCRVSSQPVQIVENGNVLAAYPAVAERVVRQGLIGAILDHKGRQWHPLLSRCKKSASLETFSTDHLRQILNRLDELHAGALESADEMAGAVA